jgi:outer membrane protein OmpA-like peptidoglycan-associated protein
MAGVDGAAGRSGPSGARGEVGPMGTQGAPGVVERWTSFRDVNFDYESDYIKPSEASKFSEIAAYMKGNPSLNIGVDGSMDPRGSDPRNQDLSDRRISAVVNALVEAGVPAHRIETGAFGDSELRQDRRVEVLISTRRVSSR